MISSPEAGTPDLSRVQTFALDLGDGRASTNAEPGTEGFPEAQGRSHEEVARGGRFAEHGLTGVEDALGHVERAAYGQVEVADHVAEYAERVPGCDVLALREQIGFPVFREPDRVPIGVVCLKQVKGLAFA